MEKNFSNGISMGLSHWKLIDRWAEQAGCSRSWVFQSMVEHLARMSFEKVDPDGFWWTWKEKDERN